MKMENKIQEALNDQMNAEMYSSNLYLAMAAYFDSLTLRGFAHWMKLQAKEERGHAMKFYEYLDDRNARIAVASIKAPPAEWKSPLAAVEAALAQEQAVTKSIHEILELAMAKKDHATFEFLQWFVKEQVDEEAQTDEMARKLKMFGEETGLYLLDKELGERKE